MMTNEVQLHQLAKLFVDQFVSLEPMSLDEFLIENEDILTDEEKSLGYAILAMFNY
jgi:hypothetical protein